MGRRCSIVLVLALVAACGTRGEPVAPIVVQGAMDIEVRAIAAALENPVEERIEGWTFWKGTIDGYPVIVSKTLKGMTNAAAATVLAAEHFHPAAIINQGTAGGHQPDLKVADIVVGIESVNLGSFKTGYRAAGRGSDFGEWVPLDLLRSDGSAGNDPQARRMRRFAGDAGLIDAARQAQPSYKKGGVVFGVIGSADVWNSEIDRIRRFHEEFGTTVEEMETASAAQIAGAFKIPFLGIRVVSNNITNDGTYDGATAVGCQEFVQAVVRAYVSARRSNQPM